MLESKKAKLQALQNRFREQLPGRMLDIESAWASYQARSSNVDIFNNFLRLVHSLAGSAGTFGYGQLGVLARGIEAQLRTHGKVLGQIDLEPLADFMRQLAECAQRAPEVETSDAPLVPQRASAPDVPLIYVLEDESVLASEIQRQLMNFGFNVAVFLDRSSLSAALDQQMPHALVIDIHLENSAFEGPGFALEKFTVGEPAPPIIFISRDDSWQARLAAAKAGGKAYLTKPLDFSALIDALDRYVGRSDKTPSRILVVDDDALLAQHFAAVLQSGGMIPEVLSDPAQLLSVITTFKPELILMDLHMPSCSGVEAAQVIRQNPAHINIPIVYLSTETGLGEELAAMSVGGDDFLHKPISDAHLIAAVEFRVERFRALRDLMGLDGLTGLLNHIALKLTLESDMEHARRVDTNLCFAMVDIDNFKSVNDKYGHPIGDRVIKSLARLLKQRLRKSDVVGRHGGEEFALILRDTDPTQAHAVIDGLREFFADIKHIYGDHNFSSSFSAGIASMPPHTDMDVLISAADHALYKAKAAGRNCVVVDQSSQKS